MNGSQSSRTFKSRLDETMGVCCCCWHLRAETCKCASCRPETEFLTDYWQSNVYVCLGGKRRPLRRAMVDGAPRVRVSPAPSPQDEAQNFSRSLPPRHRSDAEVRKAMTGPIRAMTDGVMSFSGGRAHLKLVRPPFPHDSGTARPHSISRQIPLGTWVGGPGYPLCSLPTYHPTISPPNIPGI